MIKQRIALGDIVAVPLPNGRFAFGREFESGLGVYDYIGQSINDIPQGVRRFLFIVGVVRQDLCSGQWPKIAKDTDLPKNSIGWVSGYIKDAMNGSFSKYDHESGQSQAASYDECKGLEQIAAWGANHVVDRILAYQQGLPSVWLADSPWIPDVVEIGADGRVSARIPFKQWSATTKALKISLQRNAPTFKPLVVHDSKRKWFYLPRPTRNIFGFVGFSSANFSIYLLKMDIGANKAKGLYFPSIRGTWLPSFDIQITGGLAINWLGIRVRISL